VQGDRARDQRQRDFPPAIARRVRGRTKSVQVFLVRFERQTIGKRWKGSAGATYDTSNEYRHLEFPVVTCLASQVVNYLHATAAATNFLASFVQNSNSLSAGYSVSNTLTGIGGAVTNASQCFFKADTFLVIYIKSASTLFAKRIYFSAGAAA